MTISNYQFLISIKDSITNFRKLELIHLMEISKLEIVNYSLSEVL